ncbi:MAG: biliverdin-producing heme oxygenase [Phycisphaerales bacterium]|jgi:heme oxygenase
MTDHRTSPSVHHRNPPTLSESLKAQSRDWHNLAAGHPFERRLLAGQATRDDYARYLGQLLHVHLALEQPLRGRASGLPVFATVVRPYHFRVSGLLEDLHTLDHRPASHPALPATGLLCERINDLAAQMPVALLGTLYVLEGSTNGGRFIADVVRRSLTLPPGAGTAYLDPHGPAQHERWQGFKSSLDQLDFRPRDREAIIAAACDAFRGVHDILEDLTHPALPHVVARPPSPTPRLAT